MAEFIPLLASRMYRLADRSLNLAMLAHPGQPIAMADKLLRLNEFVPSFDGTLGAGAKKPLVSTCASWISVAANFIAHGFGSCGA